MAETSKKKSKQSENNSNKMAYIQYSKKVTKWGITLVTIALILCLYGITMCNLRAEAISAITTLYTAYVTIIGITIGAYQGNSSVEKWSKARYQYNDAMNWNENPLATEQEYSNETING